MAFWNKLFGGGNPRHVDYYNEGLELLADKNFHEALTSFRLALKQSGGDTVILQQIAICYTRIGMMEEAAKTYRHVLHRDASASSSFSPVHRTTQKQVAMLITREPLLQAS